MSVFFLNGKSKKQVEEMHSCTNELFVKKCLLRDVCHHSTPQYRRPTQAKNVTPSPRLLKFEMRYMYLGPNMNAMNATPMKGHVTADF